MKEQQVIYFSDELNDDFAETKDDIKPLSDKFVYFSTNPFWQIKHFFWNKIVAYPVAYLHAKCRFKWKVKNKKLFKKVKKTGYFIYGNHTQQFFDAAMSKILANHEAYVMVNQANLNLKGLGWLVKRLGALPVPTNVHETKRFVSAVDKLMEKHKSILIYPEAHIWPYYTKIRPFVSTSFRYPVKYNVPAFCFTNTYHKRKNGKVQITTYVDGPFYPNSELPTKERTQALRDQIYETMVERSKLSDYEFVKYIKKDTKIENSNEKNATHNC